jgi:hypothetical protein
VDLGAGNGHAEPFEDLHPGRLEQDARADRTGLGSLLEQRDAVPVAGEQQGGGAAGGARADDGDATHG